MGKLIKQTLPVLLLLLSGLAPAAHAQITSPVEAFGFHPGEDRKLADWKQLTAYFQKLSTETDKLRYEELGKTTEGRPFVALTISSPENIAHLERYKQIAARLGDPRITTPDQAKALIAEGKTVLLVTCNIHSTEIASSQSAAEFAYRLSSQDTPQIRNILQNVIIVLVPSLNPDGQQIVVDWYKKYLGTPYEGGDPVVLWHHYVGHDDNRDWATFTQIETQLGAKLFNQWHPQILYDLHQQGKYAARIYLPPFVDPFDPNIDPLLISSQNALGTNTALEIAQTGKKGVLSYGVYDFWSPLRDYAGHHNALRILTESASVDIATPVNIPFEKLARGIGYDPKVVSWNFPDPWKGGEWHLHDIVDYQLDAFFSIAGNAATYRERYLTNFYKISEHEINRSTGPSAYIVPAGQADSAAAARLINTLRTGGVEVQQATEEFSAEGRHYPRGSYIVPLAQPYGTFAKTLLEAQHYPNIPEYPGGPLQKPYDVTAQTLPLLFGVQAVAVQEKLSVPGTAVDMARPTPGQFDKSTSGKGYLISDSTNSSLYALFALLKDKVRAYRLTGPGAAPGTIYIPQQAGIEAHLSAVARKFPVEVRAAPSVPTGDALEVRLPRIGLYQSWIPSMDEGWTRWIFDQNGIPYARLVDADIRQGHLERRFDVILIPDNGVRAITEGVARGGEEAASGTQTPASAEPTSVPLPPEYAGGLGKEGLASLRAFAEAGGTIVTLNKASRVYATKDSKPVSDALAAVSRNNFYIPGSILQVTVDTKSPLAFGLPATVPIFYENGPSFSVSGAARSVASFTTDEPLLSGWILGGQYLKGTSVVAEEPAGQGRIILFGFRPQYRAQSEVTYKLLFNALLYSASRQKSLGGTPAGPG